MIDVGKEETEKVHQLEYYSLFEKQDRVYQLSYEAFSGHQNENVNKLRHNILPTLIEGGSITTHSISSGEAINHLRNSSRLQKLELDKPQLRKSDLDLIIDGFREFNESQPSSSKENDMPLFPILLHIGTIMFIIQK